METTSEKESCKESEETPLARSLRAELDAALRGHHDPILILLKSHLHIENLLERLIVAYLPRGDSVTERARLSFFQKLVLLDSMELIPDSILTPVRHLNKLRNDIAHRLDRHI
jgi:hypothetical protein